QSALRTVCSDNRFTNEDRADIEALLPETGAFESPANASVKVTILTAFFLRRMSNSLRDLGIDSASIPTLTPEQVAGFVKEGLMTEDEAAASLRMLFPEQFRSK